jgi:hypothetical protein
VRSRGLLLVVVVGWLILGLAVMAVASNRIHGWLEDTAPLAEWLVAAGTFALALATFTLARHASEEAQLVRDEARRSRETRVNLRLDLGHAVERGVGWHRFLVIEVHNDSDFPVRVTSAGLGNVDADGTVTDLLMWPQAPEATIPGTIEPRDFGFTFRGDPFDPTDYGQDFGNRMFAWARLTPLDEVRTAPVAPDQIGLHPDAERFTPALEAALVRQRAAPQPEVGAVSPEQLRAAARLLRTELADTRNKIEMFRTSPIIPDGFGFPASEWAEHRQLIASEPELYTALENAYTKAHRANEVFGWRRTQAQSRLIGVNWAADGLDEVDAAAHDAIAALDALLAG